MFKSWKMNSTQRNLVVDLTIAAGFLLAAVPALTGQSIHEWLGLALAVGLITHLLLHWRWIVEVTQRYFRPLPWETRINYLLNTALLFGFSMVIASGIFISREAVTFLNIEHSSSVNWKMIHIAGSDLILFAAGLHIALHWRWLVNSVKRYVLRLAPRRARQQAPALEPVTVEAVQK